MLWWRVQLAYCPLSMLSVHIAFWMHGIQHYLRNFKDYRSGKRDMFLSRPHSPSRVMKKYDSGILNKQASFGFLWRCYGESVVNLSLCPAQNHLNLDGPHMQSSHLLFAIPRRRKPRTPPALDGTPSSCYLFTADVLFGTPCKPTFWVRFHAIFLAVQGRSQRIPMHYHRGTQRNQSKCCFQCAEKRLLERNKHPLSNEKTKQNHLAVPMQRPRDLNISETCVTDASAKTPKTGKHVQQEPSSNTEFNSEFDETSNGDTFLSSMKSPTVIHVIAWNCQI